MVRLSAAPTGSIRSLVVFAAVLSAGVARASPPEGEVARIRAHLGAALEGLAKRDLSELTEAQRRRRHARIADLEDYVARGAFPENDGFPERRMPYFVDRGGTRCAMAYLMEESGRPDLVARVARTANNAFIRELGGDAELAAWLEQNGLTLDEAAMIQPTYEPNCHAKSQCICGIQGGNIEPPPPVAVIRARVKERVRPTPMIVLEVHGDAADLAVDEELIVDGTVIDAEAGEEVLIGLMRDEYWRRFHFIGTIAGERVACTGIDDALSLEVPIAIEAFLAEDCGARLRAANSEFEGEYGPECGACTCSGARAAAASPQALLLVVLLLFWRRRSAVMSR